MRHKTILFLAVMSGLGVPTLAAATTLPSSGSNAQLIRKLDQKFGLTCYQIDGDGPLFCGKKPGGGPSASVGAPVAMPFPVVRATAESKPFQAAKPYPPTSRSTLRVQAAKPLQASTASPSPDLSGFHQAFHTEPLLVQHGTEQTTLTAWHGSATAGQVLEKILPAGWHVYTKGDLQLMLSAPILYTDTHAKPWIQVLQAVMKQSGIHADIWWDQKILMLSDMPILPSYTLPTDTQTATPFPSIEVGEKTKSAPLASTPPAASPAMPLPAAKPYPPTSRSTLRVQAGKPLLSAGALPAAKPFFALNRGDLILTDLQKWAKQSGWTVVWQVPEDWQVPNTTTFSGNFRKAVSHVVQALSANGANVHAVFHTANNTVVISGAGGGE